MGEIRSIEENLPDYNFPNNSVDPEQVMGYSLVQSRTDGVWEPRWCLIDSDGNPLVIFEADSFEDLSPVIVAQKAAEFVMELHQLSEEETGHRIQADFKHGNGSESYTFELK
jgi:hypothetical protein